MIFNRKKRKRRRNLKLNRSQVNKRQTTKTKYSRKRSPTSNRFKGNLKVKRQGSSKRILLYFSYIAAISGAIYFFLFSQFFNLQNWEVVEKEITFTNHELTKFLKPFTNQNLFLINTETVKNEIQKAHPNLSDIEIQKVFPKTIRIKIRKYPLTANIINQIGDEQINEKLIVNSIGLVVEKNNVNPDLPTIKIQTPKSAALLQKIIEPQQLQYIQELTSEFENFFGLKITEIHFKQTERQINLTTEKNFVVWLDIQKDYQQQLKKLKKAMSKLDLYNTPLEYIDLRISGVENEKVIFRRK